MGNATAALEEAQKDLPDDKKYAITMSAASEILHRPNVQKELQRLMQELKNESVATAEEVMKYFTSVMRGEVKDQFGIEASLAERTRAAQEIARRTIDIDNRVRLREAEDNAGPIQITLNWARNDEQAN